MGTWFNDPHQENATYRDIQERRRRFYRSSQQVTPQLAANVVNLATTYPTLPTGLITGAAVAGVDPGSEQMRQLALNAAIKDEEQGQFDLWGGIGETLQSGVRGAFGLMDMLWEEAVARPIRTTVGKSQGMDWGEAWQMAGMSASKRAMLKAFDPNDDTTIWERLADPFTTSDLVPEQDRINMGDGWFNDSTLITQENAADDPYVRQALEQGQSLANAMAQAQRQYGAPLMDQAKRDAERIRISHRGTGQTTPVSLGRLAAIQVFAPDSGAFNITSGLIDGVSRLVADPADKFLGVYKKVGQLSNVITENGHFLTRSLDDLMASAPMRELAEETAQWGRQDMHKIMTVWGGKLDNNPSGAAFMGRLADTTTADEVLGVVKDAMQTNLYGGRSPFMLSRRGALSSGADSIRLGGANRRRLGELISGPAGKYSSLPAAVSLATKNTRVNMLLSEMGGSAIQYSNPTEGMKQLDNFLRMAGFTTEESSDYLYRMSKVGADALIEDEAGEVTYEAFAIVSDAMKKFGEKLKAEGLPEPVVNHLTDMYSTQESFRKYWVRAVDGLSHRFTGGKIAMSTGDTEVAIPAAQLVTEMTSRSIPLPDARKVRKAMQSADLARLPGGNAMLGRIKKWDDFDEASITKIADWYVGKVWKPLTLARFAWPVRVISEEQFRMLGNNYLSLMNHPLQYLGWATASGSKFGDSILGKAVNAGAGETDVFGQAWAAQRVYKEGMSTRAALDLDHGRQFGSSEFTTFRKGEREWAAGYFGSAIQLHNDPIAAEVARAMRRNADEGVTTYLDEIKERFANGDLSRHRRQLLADARRWDWMESRQWSDGYIDSINARIHELFGGEWVAYDEYGRWWNSLGQRVKYKDLPSFVKDAAPNHPLAQWDSVGLFDNSEASTEGFGELLDTLLADDLVTSQEATELDALYNMLAGGVDETELTGIVNGIEDVLRNVAAREGVDRFATFADEAGDAWEALANQDIQTLRRLARDKNSKHMAKGMENLGPGVKKPAKHISKIDRSYDGASQHTGIVPVLSADGGTTAYHYTQDGYVVATAHVTRDGDRIVGMHLTSHELPDAIGVPRQGKRRLVDQDWVPNTETPQLNKYRSYDDWDDVKDLDVDGRLSFSREATSWVRDVYRNIESSDNLNVLREVWESTGRDADRLINELQELSDDFDKLHDSVLLGRGNIVTGRQNRERYKRLVDWLDENVFADDMSSRMGSIFRDPNAGMIELPPTGPAFDKDAAVKRALLKLKSTIEGFGDEISLRTQMKDMLYPADPTKVESMKPLHELMATRLIDDIGMDAERVRNMGPEELVDAVLAAADDHPEVLANLSDYPLSTQGAEAAVMLQRGRGKIDPAKSIPQHRPQYYITKEGGADGLNFVADGKLNGRSVANINDRKELANVIDEFNAAFGGIGAQVVKGVSPASKNEMGQWDKIIDQVFNTLMSAPTDKMSRSPIFRQAYWRRMAEMLPNMSEADQAHVLAQMRKAGIEEGWFQNQVRNTVRRVRGKEALDRTEGAAAKMAGRVRGFEDEAYEAATLVGGLDDVTFEVIEKYDVAAKAFALEETKRLLYDLSRRHNIADMTRNIFPFAEAWGEILTSWGRIMYNNPRMARRGQVAVQGAFNSGFFYEDPVSGENVFNYPGQKLLTRLSLGEDSPAQITPTGRVAGLNIIGGGYLPGFGPLVQIPASNLMSDFLDNPSHKWVRDMLIPFGKEDFNGIEDALKVALPGWMRKAFAGFGMMDEDMQRLYGNTVMDVQKALLAGSESNATGESQYELLERSKQIARNLFLVRGMAQFAAPTSPSLRFDIRDKYGQIWAFGQLASEWARMQKENDYDEQATFQQFTDRFGLDPTLFATSKTAQLQRRAVTDPSLEWELENEDLFQGKFANTAYYAAPDDPFAEFSYPAYLRQLEEKTRVPLTPEQWQTERNDFLGRIAYERARRMVGGRTDDAARGWLRQQKFQLMELYPGYNEPNIGVGKASTRDMMFEELKDWQYEPRLANTEAGQAVVRYMRDREQALQLAASIGITEQGFGTAKRTAELRAWLLNRGRYYSMMYADFGPVFDQVLSREVETEEVDSETF